MLQLKPSTIRRFGLIHRSFASKTPTHSAITTIAKKEMKHFVLTVTGDERTGIVTDATKIIKDHLGNIGESRSLKLGSHFSLMMLVSLPSTSYPLCTSSLKAGVPNCNVETYETTVSDMNGDSDDAQNTLPVTLYGGYLKFEGKDQPGSIYGISRILAKHGLSIDRLETTSVEGEFGEEVCVMEGVVTHDGGGGGGGGDSASSRGVMPEGWSSDIVREELAEYGEREECTILLEDVDPFEDYEDDKDELEEEEEAIEVKAVPKMKGKGKGKKDQ